MVPKNITIEYDPDIPYVQLLFLSDQHLGHADFARPYYRRVLTENLSQPNTYLISNGDALDCVTPRDKRFEMGGVDPRYLAPFRPPDEILDHQVEDFIEEHWKYRHQILGLGMGNHEHAITRHYGTNPHRRICKALDTINLGYSCIVDIFLKPKGVKGRVRSFRFMQHHGWGGGTRTEGGALSGYSSYANYWDCDMAVFGHKHDYVYKRFPRLGKPKRQERLIHNDIIVALTGSFLKTFNESDMPNYAERGGFRPTVLRGGWLLKIYPQWDTGLRTKMSEA